MSQDADPLAGALRPLGGPLAGALHPLAGTLAGRVALVTGASRGIGEAIALRLAADGAAVAVTARTVEDGDHVLAGGIAATVGAIVSAGGHAVAIPADLALPEDRQRLIERTRAELGPIDVLVNNAAITYFEQVADFADRHYQLMFEVQVRAPLDLAQRVLPEMRRRARGWILNISSGAARHPQGPPYGHAPGGTVYGMCKAALERFTTGLASEVSRDGIAVNALSPSGLVLTPGVIHHGLDQRIPIEHHEPVAYMAEAAWLLCTGDPESLTGRVAYARPLLEEFDALPVG
ncbi:MAG: SDR family NAD(P)-dependent oxidoreductase [Acidimicrobiales bacterium]